MFYAIISIISFLGGYWCHSFMKTVEDTTGPFNLLEILGYIFYAQGAFMGVFAIVELFFG